MKRRFAESRRKGLAVLPSDDRWRQTRFPAQSFLRPSDCNYESLAASGNFDQVSTLFLRLAAAATFFQPFSSRFN